MPYFVSNAYKVLYYLLTYVNINRNKPLEELMKNKRLSQADLCRGTDIPTSLMSNYLNGKKSPALSNALAIDTL
mgnify:CR=1 FL=1